MRHERGWDIRCEHFDPAEILEEVLVMKKDIAAKAKALMGKIVK